MALSLIWLLKNNMKEFFIKHKFLILAVVAILVLAKILHHQKSKQVVTSTANYQQQFNKTVEQTVQTDVNNDN